MKSLSPQQNFVTAISHAKSNQFEFVQFVVGTNSFAETKIFTKKAPIHIGNLSLQHVTQLAT